MNISSARKRLQRSYGNAIYFSNDRIDYMTRKSEGAKLSVSIRSMLSTLYFNVCNFDLSTLPFSFSTQLLFLRSFHLHTQIGSRMQLLPSTMNSLQDASDKFYMMRNTSQRSKQDMSIFIANAYSQNG